jgi:hypothetical protein
MASPTKAFILPPLIYYTSMMYIPIPPMSNILVFNNYKKCNAAFAMNTSNFSSLPRFTLVFPVGLINRIHAIPLNQPNVSSVGHRMSTQSVNTFPPVYKTQSSARPTFGQIWPRGITNKS